MSDTTNALSGSSGANSGLINAIAHPTVVNPLAAYQSALQTAKSDYEVQQLRANKAIGDILQQSTDENGNVNYETAGRLAAAAGPVVQSGMQEYLKNASVLRGQQLAQGVTRNAAASNAIIGALNGDDAGLHDRVVSGLQGLVSNGVMTQDEATRSALSLPSDPTQLRQRLQQIQTQLAPPDLQQQRVSGAPFRYTGPGGDVRGGTQDINTGAVSTPPQQGAPQGPSPETGVELVDVTYTGPDGKQYPAKVFRKDIPGYGGAVTPPGGGATNPPGAPAAGSSGIGSGRINPTPANPALRNPAVAQPPPTPQGGGAVGGAQPFVTGPAIGATEKQKADVAAYTQDQADYPMVQTRAQNMAHAFEALKQLKSATGKGAAGINALRSYAQTLGILPEGAVNEQKLFEIVTKYTERAMIDAAGGSTTDMGRRMQEQANAGTLLSTPANFEIMRNDMGKSLQMMAAYKDTDPKSGGVGHLENRAKVADTTDPRGFVWDLYSPDEQARINAEVAKNPTAATKLHKAIGMSRRLQLQIPGLTTGQ